MPLISKVALTDLLPVITTVQVVLVLVQSPVHLTNLEPEEAEAVRVAEEFQRRLTLQITPQSIPAGLLVILPEPRPDRKVVKV